MKSLHQYAFTLATVLTCAVGAEAYQQGKRPDPPSPPPSSPARTTTTTTRKPKNKERAATANEGARVRKEPPRPERAASPKPAELVVSTNPPDSLVFINGVEYPARQGVVRQSQLKPDTYKVIVRRDGYQEEEYTVSLAAGTSMPLDVSLEPTLATINVTPNVGGSEIIVRDAANDRHVGRYDERVTNLHVPPGRYEIAVSKKGYHTARREVTVSSSQIVYLEPPLERLAPERPRVRADAATTIRILPDGKFLVVELTGKSGDASRTMGAVDVAVSMKGDTQSVSGMLTGYPCRVDFVRMENVSEYAFAEAPGAANQWGRVVVRVRPKDSKRPMRFLVNWVTLANTSAGGDPAASYPAKGQAAAAALAPFTAAVAVKKVTPVYPSSARLSHAEGVVTVTVEINERGDVVSAKATDGPVSLRNAAEDAARQWKFNPAREGTQPVSSTLSLQFAFRL